MTPVSSAPTRTRILDAAFELFWLQGYDGTGIAEILEKADVNSGSLYNLFASKEQVLLAVLDRCLDQLYPEVMEPAFQQTTDPLERIFAVLEGYRRGLQITECTGGCPMGNLSIEVGDHIPAAREKIWQNFENWRKWILLCLEEAGPRLPATLDRDQLATFILTVMEGGVMQARASASLKPFDACVAQLRSYFDALMKNATLEVQFTPEKTE